MMTITYAPKKLSAIDRNIFAYNHTNLVPNKHLHTQIFSKEEIFALISFLPLVLSKVKVLKQLSLYIHIIQT